MRHVRVFTLAALVICVLVPSAAFADITAFVGATTSPANRTAKGLAIGGGLLFLGFEFEYSDTTDDTTAGAPALKTVMGNVLLQTPIAIYGVQPYFAVGAGGYDESLGTTVSNTGFAASTGGGVKINLIGPIRLRVDYRVFTLRNGAMVTPSHRIYAGLNLKF